VYVCLLYQEIELSCECVFIVSGELYTINTLTQDSSPYTINTLTQVCSPDTTNTHTQDSSPDAINTHTQDMYQEIELSWVCVFIV
jgi:hypothetical protein